MLRNTNKDGLSSFSYTRAVTIGGGYESQFPTFRSNFLQTIWTATRPDWACAILDGGET